MGVLGRDELGKRLDSESVSERIFVPRTWSRDSVRGAAYDLRVAADFLILPDGQRFWPEAPDPADRASFAAFELKPGEVAFVSSVERLTMPWDLAGNVAPKFRPALNGLFVMGGMLVDPGYGRVRREDGEWVEHEDGERLHFQLVNLGMRPFRIEPTETCIAAIQFVTISGDSRRETPRGPELDLATLDVPTPEKLLRDLFHPHTNQKLPQLAFFFRTAGFEERIKSTEEGLVQSEMRMSFSERASNQLYVFGLFLLLITVIGLSIAALVNSLAG